MSERGREKGTYYFSLFHTVFVLIGAKVKCSRESYERRGKVVCPLLPFYQRGANRIACARAGP